MPRKGFPMAYHYLRIIKTLSVPAYSAILVESNSDSCECEETGICRASDLPIYTQCETPDYTGLAEKEERLPGYLEQAIVNIKTMYTKCTDTYAEVKETGKEVYYTTKNNIITFVTYLREEENTPQRIAAIGTGGLIGLLFGMRGRFIKKTFYTTLGALGVAAVCYPEEAHEIGSAGWEGAQELFDNLYGQLYPDKPSPVVVQEKVQEKVEEGAAETSTVQDPQEVITKTHDSAVSKSCHCPIGACLHSDDEGSPVSSDTS